MRAIPRHSNEYRERDKVAAVQKMSIQRKPHV